MQSLRALAVCAFAFIATLAAARAETPVPQGALPSKVDLRADDIAFYPYANASLLAARGHVVLRAGARRIAGDALRWDLIRNKLLVTGDVRVSDATHGFACAAYSLDMPAGSATFLRADPVPATFALRGDDDAKALETPAADGTFDVDDLDGQRPYMRSHHAIVTPNAGVRMLPAEFPSAAGPSLTLPTYLYTLVQNPLITNSAAPASSFDQPYSLFGSPASLTAAHLRYDGQNGVTGALDERLVDRDRAYVVSSLLPFRDRQFDLLAYQALRPGLQQQFSATHYFGLFPGNVLDYSLTDSGRLTRQALVLGQIGSSNTAELDVATYLRPFAKVVNYRFNAAYGYDHNAGGIPYANDFRTTLGGFVATRPALVLGTSVGANYQYDLTSYDYPHEVTSGTLTFTAGRTFSRAVSAYGLASFSQNDNRYRDVATGAVALGLPPPGTPYFAPDGTAYPGYFAYAGLNTYRTYSLTTTFSGRGDNRIALTLTRDADFPQYHGFGRPPYYAFLDVVRRITPALRVELGRAYTFGWNGQHLSPEWVFGISP
jgi:hypothetical protein